MSKGKSSFKGILFLFLIIAIIGGVILAVIYWPKNPGEIKAAISDQNTYIFSDESDFRKEWNKYGEYTIEFAENNKNNGYTAISNIIDGLEVYFEYMDYTFTSADFGKYNTVSLNNAKKHLYNAKTKAEQISEFLKDKNNSLTKDGFNTKQYTESDASLVWENIKPDLRTFFEAYNYATADLATLYKENVNKGVYSNDFANIIMDSVSYYMNYFYENYELLEGKSEKKTTSIESYTNMSINFKVFTTSYLSKIDNTILVSQYLISESLQKDTESVKKFNELMPETLTLESLIKSEFGSISEDLTDEQTATLATALKFCTGGFTKWKDF